MKNYATASSTPEAFVTKGKQRVKQFGGTVYLKDGDNFEIELFNPTSNYVLAKISLDGKLISSSGLILRPGERIHLERYIDSNNKFLYSTYEVNGKNNEVQNAIRSNGNVKVEFYNEIPVVNYPSYPSTVTIWPPIYSTPTINPTWLTTSSPSYGTLPTSGGVSYKNYNTITGQNGFTGPQGDMGSQSTIGGNGSNTTFFCSTSPGVSANHDNGTLTSSSYELKSTLKKTHKSKIETGTVEKGESSNQSFTTLNRNFYSYTFKTVEWKILPHSQKPVMSEDLKMFCTNCGSKITKSTFKFCPNCGEKLE